MNRKISKEEKEKFKKKLKAQWEKDKEPVKGIFHFYEVPGGRLSFPLKLYPWDEVENYTFDDGQIYTVPLKVAKHLNKNGWYPLHRHALDENGKAKMHVAEKKRRFGFQSLEFIDPAEIGEAKAQEIVTVTPVEGQNA
jgi:hypothetical protein